MKRLSSPLEKIGLKAGLVTSLALIAYFFIMESFGLTKMLEFRYFNFFILLAGVYYAINSFKRIPDQEELYMQGIGIGVFTSAVAVISFALFMSIYLAYIDPGLMAYVKAHFFLPDLISGFSVFIIISLEGLASGLIISFCLMQYFKTYGLKTKKTLKTNTGKSERFA